MRNEQHTESSRAALTFTLQGLPYREQLLFKFLVRLSDHRTHQSWSHTPEAESLKADVLFVADGSKPLPDFSGHYAAQRVITLGSAGAGREGFLCRPLVADALEAALNRVGRLVLSSRQNGEAPAQSPAVTEASLLRLVRWPQAALVRTPDQMRLATLMTNRPMTLAELEQRSGLDAAVCAAFVTGLEKAGYLSTSAQETSAYVHGAAGVSSHAKCSSRPGLLSRIRTRLGIQPFGAQ